MKLNPLVTRKPNHTLIFKGIVSSLGDHIAMLIYANQKVQYLTLFFCVNNEKFFHNQGLMWLKINLLLYPKHWYLFQLVDQCVILNMITGENGSIIWVL